MATTTGGTTYVTATDLVANYPTASLALANRVDVVASGGPGLVKTAGYTITVADILAGNKFLYNSASPGTFTLPTSSLVDGMVVRVAQIGAAALTVSGGTIVGTTVTTAQYQSLMLVYVASGTTWYSVAPPSTLPGLAIVTPTSIANSGGSSSASGGAVTFTGVTSISLNGVFTSTFDNYLIVSSLVASTDTGTTLRMRASGTDNSANSYTRQRLTASSTTVAASTILDTNWYPGGVDTSRSAVSFQVFSPQLAQNTTFLGGTQYGTQGLLVNSGLHAVASAFDGMTMAVQAGNMTGVIRCYGYRN